MAAPWTKRELLAYLDRVEPSLSRLNHFELLDVSATSSDTVIQDAFHQMAARMHPDRHRLLLGKSDLERLTIVYAQIAEAYRVLRDPEEKSAYLKRLARDKAADESSIEDQASASGRDSLAMLGAKAQRLYRRAQAALRTGDTTSAVLSLRMALAKHPSSTFLREALAQAKSLQKKK